MELWNGVYKIEDLVLILFRSIQRKLNKSKVKTKIIKKESNKETQSQVEISHLNNTIKIQI